jgi:hypothetical protein
MAAADTRDFRTDYSPQTLVEDVDYIGPHLAERLHNSKWYGQPKPINTLGDLRTLLLTRAGANIRKRFGDYLEETLMNKRPRKCVRSRSPDGAQSRYKVRKANRNGYDALVTWLKANVPAGQRNRVPAPKRDRTAARAWPNPCISE